MPASSTRAACACECHVGPAFSCPRQGAAKIRNCNAQQPMLYKFALGDFRRALRYDPGNADARAKLDQIVSIYQSMGKPVPTNGQEQ